ncbi:MAG: serine/threonine-protein kinase [Planctomycetota bacterium]
MSDAARAEQIFAEALALGPAQRDAFLTRCCAGDPGLRAEVESLLGYDALPGSFLDAPALLDRAITAEPLAGEVPERIDSYRILGVLGEGGMGIVLRAEQESPRRVVALKIIRPGREAPAMVRRFVREAEILGRLQHPCIAQIFAAGTLDERTLFPERPGAAAPRLLPYFAMELVDGLPLGEHCQRYRLTANERLALLAKLGDGVHYAHAHGIVHRDLKPGNILVARSKDGDDRIGQPKILDFGIARTIAGEMRVSTLLTDVGQILGTASYMSPEQCAGDPGQVDARADVYSLGVIGFELLTGRLPLAVADRSLADAMRMIREQDPPAAGALVPSLRGDVSTILAHALEKEPARRYASAADLAADIRRHLHHEPIHARPASTWYTLCKFTRRHRPLVTGMITAALGLMIALVLVAREALRAHRAEARALDRAEESDQVQRFLRDMLASVDPANRPGHEVTVREVLDAASGDIEGRFPGRPAVEAALRQTLGSTYASLLLFERAEPHCRRLLDLLRALRGPEHEDTLAAELLLASSLVSLFRYQEAEAMIDECLASIARTHASSRLALDAERVRANLLRMTGRDQEAIASLEAAVELARTSLPEASRERIALYGPLGWALDQVGRLEDADRVARAWQAAARQFLGDAARDTIAADLLIADIARARERFDQAEARARDALATARKTFGASDPLTLQALYTLGSSLYFAGRVSDATPLLQEAASLGTTLGEQQRDVLFAKDLLVNALYTLGRLEPAEQLAREMVAARTRLSGASSSAALNAAHNLARVLAARGRMEEAEALERTTLARRIELDGEAHIDTLATMCALASILLQRSKPAEAVELLEHEIELETDLQDGATQGVLDSRHLLAMAKLRQGHAEEALALIEDVVAEARQLFPAGHPTPWLYQATLGECLAATRRFAEAESTWLSAYDGAVGALGKDHHHCRLLAAHLLKLYTEQGRADAAQRFR